VEDPAGDGPAEDAAGADEDAGAADEEAGGAALGAAPLVAGAAPVSPAPAGGAGAGVAAGLLGPPACKKVTVSSMSCMRSLLFFTAPSYSGFPDAFSMNVWKICLACW